MSDALMLVAAKATFSDRIGTRFRASATGISDMSKSATSALKLCASSAPAISRMLRGANAFMLVRTGAVARLNARIVAFP